MDIQRRSFCGRDITMQDMIIAGTGNSRYLKSSIDADITLSELVSMLRAGTFPFDFNGINPAGITQEGTPLNTATLLSDDTAEKIWGTVNGNPTVNLALAARTLLTGSSAPTTSTVGAIGQFYWDTANEQLYVCVTKSQNSYTWIIVATGLKLIKTLKTEIIDSTQNWVVPHSVAGATLKVTVRIFGGGGGGKSAGGNGGDMAVGTFTLQQGDSIPVTIGTGGRGSSSGTASAGGTSSFGELLSALGGQPNAGNSNVNTGGTGGGGQNNGGHGTYGGGGGAGGSYSSNTGGNGGEYGGGGGAPGNNSGTGGTYGGNGGKAGSISTATGENGTNTTGMGLDFEGEGLGGQAVNSNTSGCGGGGYGGNGGVGGQAYSSRKGGGGGGGGYGADGGDGGDSTSSAYSGGGGGGGYGGRGGNGGAGSCGGGGGYGISGNGGTTGSPNGGIAAGGMGEFIYGDSGGNGGNGVCILTYFLEEFVIA